MVVESQSGDTRIRLALGEKTIAGAVVMGDKGISLPLHEMIAARADVSDILPRLQAPAAPVAEIVLEYWPSVRAQFA